MDAEDDDEPTEGPNEYGVFSNFGAERLRFESKKAWVEIRVKETAPGEWRHSLFLEFHFGALQGVSYGMSEAVPPAKSRGEAVHEGVMSVRRAIEESHRMSSSLSKPGEEALLRLTAWLDSLLRPEAAQLPLFA